MRARSCFALIALASLVATPGAQTSSTPPDTKGSDFSLIRLDIHPTADGQPVHDLAAADLDLIEDGAPQKIDRKSVV